MLTLFAIIFISKKKRNADLCAETIGHNAEREY